MRKSPEISEVVIADDIGTSESCSARPSSARSERVTGVQGQGMGAQGFSGNLGDLDMSEEKKERARQNRGPGQPQPADALRRYGKEPTSLHGSGPGIEQSAATSVGVRRLKRTAESEACREVGVAHSSVEAGERDRKDPVERRGGRSTDPLAGKAAELPGPVSVSTKRQRIAELAKQDPNRVLTSLAHHIDLPWMQAAYQLTRKDGAVGVDGQTGADYAAKLDENLAKLLESAKSGQYQAPPVRRVHIAKGNTGTTRPLGIPTFEDKVLQRAVAMVLESVYEQEFLACSYGYRPGRGAVQAAERVREVAMEMRGGTVIELDISKFFDSLSHAHLREFLGQRIRDGVLLRLIGKWLQAGVLEQGAVTYPEDGTPQGGVISPLLANVYLHHVLDTWFEREVKPRLHGAAEMVRYADDAVIVCERAEDAARVHAVLPKRFARYGLELHPTKTRQVTFNRPARWNQGRKDQERGPVAPGSFNFLGFTFHWGLSRQGKSVIRLRTAKDRFARAVRAIRQWCQQERHQPLTQQQAKLSQKMRGHYAYYGVRGNMDRLVHFAHCVRKAWYHWLMRRHRTGTSGWAWFNQVLRRLPLPAPRLAARSTA